MADELSINRLLETRTVALRDVVCSGDCRHKSPEECAQSTYFVFPYRGAYVRHLGSDDAVAEPNQVLFFNKDESYRVSHPVSGGDACLSLWVDEPLLSELVPKDYVRGAGELAFRRQRVRIDARAQALVALLRHGLQRGVIVEPLEGETLLLTLVRPLPPGRSSSTGPSWS
jgi:AraC family transcriptional regulator